MASLDLNPAPKTLVFRRLIQIIRDDPTIRRIFPRDASFRCWTGKPQDSQPFAVDMAPAIRFTPWHGPDQWQFPEAFKGDLLIQVEMIVRGSDADDVMNLWWAIERALYPADFARKNGNIAALNTAGAWPGTAEFAQPVYDYQPADNYFNATGQIKISVREDIV